MSCQGCRCFLQDSPQAEGLQPEFYGARVTLFTQGDPIYAGFIVCEGAVQLTVYTTQGSRVILKFLGSYETSSHSADSTRFEDHSTSPGLSLTDAERVVSTLSKDGL